MQRDAHGLEIQNPPPALASSHAVHDLEESRQVTLWDRNNPCSILNLATDELRSELQNAYFTDEILFKMDERTLYKHIKSKEKSLSATDSRIRLKFWTEYDYAVTMGKSRMDLGRVTAGVCTREYFYATYMREPHKLAWMVCPPAGYMTKVNEALDVGIEKLREILELDAGKGPKFDTKLGELQLKITQMLEMRAKGAIVQKTLAINAHLSGAAAKQVAGATAEVSMEELDKKLAAAKKREAELMNGRTIVIPKNE